MMLSALRYFLARTNLGRAAKQQPSTIANSGRMFQVRCSAYQLSHLEQISAPL